jgi:hypothetical protein
LTAKQRFDGCKHGTEIGFGYEAFDSRFPGLVLELGAGIDRDHKNRRPGMLMGQLPGGFQAIHFRHYEIHEGEMGSMFIPCLNGAASVLGLSDDYPLILPFEDGTKMRANHRIVIHQKNTNHASPSESDDAVERTPIDSS